MIIDVGKDFYHRLANRDEHQCGGSHSAVAFRRKYLLDLDSKEAWNTDELFITFDFIGVKKIGPSFANEAFAYFTKYSKPSNILKKIKFINISNVKIMIITNELETGYKRK